MNLNSFWVKIVEANLEDLLALRVSLTSDENSVEKIYIRVLYHSLKNEIAELAELSDKASLKKFDSTFEILVRMRYEFKSMQLTEETAQNYFLNLAPLNSFYRCESLFVLGLAFQRNKNFVEARKCFEMASEGFEALGAHRKSLRSWANAVAAHSCQHPESFLIPEYKLIYQKSFKLEEWPACVGALINLSRELQRVGAMAMAFNKISEGEKIAENFMYFSREHHLCLLQKAHILSNLGHQNELKDLISILLNSPYVDVKESAEVLNAKLNNQTIKPGANTLPTWMERAAGHNEFDNKTESDSLESVLLSLLSNGEKTKEELIIGLYGDKIDFLSLENRFKNLLFRVRQKFPGRILTRAGFYELVDFKMSRKLKA